jgi:hypothetical protein
MKARLLFFLLLLIPFGCTDRKSDQRLVDLAVSIEKNSARIEELSVLLEGIGNRLAKIEEALAANLATGKGPRENAARTLAGASGTAALPSEAGETADLLSRPGEGNANLEVISRQVTVLAEELAAVKEEMTLSRAALEEVAARGPEPKDVGDIMHKLAGKPDEFARRLDEFARGVAPKIEDPTARQNFEGEVNQLRDRIVAGVPMEQLYQELRGRLVDKLNSVKDEEDRTHLEREVVKLDNSGEEELRERLTDYSRMRTVDEFFRIAKTYSVQKEDIFGFLGYGDKKGKR